jgi:hypothetical protein
MMNTNNMGDEGKTLSAAKLERMITDAHLQSALENMAMLSKKSVMAARMMVRLKCGDKVSAADSIVPPLRNSFSMVMVPNEPETQEDLELMREHLSETYKPGGRAEAALAEENERRRTDPLYREYLGLPPMGEGQKIAKAFPQ